MGDSVTSYGSVMRQKITERFNRIIASFGRQDLIDSGSALITWGADELGKYLKKKRYSSNNSCS